VSRGGPTVHIGGTEQTLADVAEGFCALCHVELIAHGDRACCPCAGCTYRLEVGRL
jgi:hypothetical protein